MSATAQALRSSTERVENDLESPKNLQHVVAGDSTDPPLIPADGVFEGQVSARGETRIEGTVLGPLRTTGRLDLGPSSRVEGDIECEDVRCQGAIVGRVVALQRVELGPGANLAGDVEAPILKVADAAVWNGKARVGTRIGD